MDTPSDAEYAFMIHQDRADHESFTRRSLESRIDAIEGRQRAYGQHDPNCSNRVYWATRDASLLYSGLPPECNCWLSKKTAE